MKATRVDQWLWAVRVFKTRSQATAACKGGHVKVNGKAAKPATPVAIDDLVQAKVHDVRLELQVLKLIDKRVGAPVAQMCYLDQTPTVEPPEIQAPFGVRERGAGKPTRRERRQLDRLRGRRP